MAPATLLITFPENVESWLTTFFNLCYATHTIPIRLEYDVLEKRYSLHVCLFRKVTCLVRVSVNILVLLNYLLFRMTTSIPTGPSGVLIAGVNIGYHLLNICYLVTTLSSWSQRGLLEFINLVKGDFQDKTVKLKQSFLVVGRVTLTIFFCTITSLIAGLINFVKAGLAKTLRVTWYGHDEEDLTEFYWWKKLISFLIFSMNVDLHLNTGNALALFVLTAKTMEATCSHFSNSIRDTQRFCVVSHDEIVLKYLKIRKAFTIISRSLGFLLLMVVFVGNLGTCTNIVWLFKYTGMSTFYKFSTLTYILGFAYFLILSGKMSNKLLTVNRFLSGQDTSHSSFLRKNIAIHEISSRNVGLNPYGIFFITYGFIAVIMVSVFSNAAIILQNYDILMAKWTVAVAKTKTDDEHCPLN